MKRSVLEKLWGDDVKIIALLSISFSIFLIIIGFAGVKQISAVNSMVVELYDSKLVPIVYLQNIKSDMEYIRSTDNKLMDATGDAAKKPIQEDIQTRIASMKEKLSKFENNSDYKELMDNFDEYVDANASFIKSNGVGAIKVQSAVVGPPTDMINLDTTKSNLALSFNKITDNQVAQAKLTYEQSKSVYSNTLVGLVSLGVAKASEVGQIIQSIIENIQNISNQIEKAIGSVAAASSEIALATENISASVEEQIGTMSEIEKTSKSLSEMARALNNITSGFKV